MQTKLYKLLIALGTLIIAPGLLPPVRPASAHNSFPAREIPLVIGPYKYQALLYNEKVNAGDRLDILLVPDKANPAGTVQLQVRALGPGGAAQTARLFPDENDHRNTAVDVPIPAPGEWRVVVAARGPAGAGEAGFALPVAPAPVIPVGAGWAIALSPLLGLAWFAAQQRRVLQQARAQGIDA